jgi:NAD(P)H-hydrate repair Nnr-like enzyme with NAD(P)H-hydrate dehydratase domain
MTYLQRHFPTTGHKVSFGFVLLAGGIAMLFGARDLASGIFFGAGIIWIGVA